MREKINCILVIDDDEPTNFFTQILLEETGAVEHIVIQQSGQEALDYLQSAHEKGNDPSTPYPDLVFLDINMPAMNGWEFLELFKAAAKPFHPMVIMLTTSLFPKDLEKAIGIPEINGFENKPLSIEKLQRIFLERFNIRIQDENQ